MRVVFDLDDLCPEFDPWEELHALKKRFPGLRVTLFCIPSRCNPSFLDKYRDLDWVSLGVHGYHHSSMECATWSGEETRSKLSEADTIIQGDRVFKAPGWAGNPEVYDTLKDMEWGAATHIEHQFDWADSSSATYCYNHPRNDGFVPIHGHTWDCMGNGPSDWDQMFEAVPEDAEFLFVKDVLSHQGSYFNAIEAEVPEGGLVVDIGAFKGEEIEWCVERGVRIESYEPHPAWAARLDEKWGDHPLVTINPQAVGTENRPTRLYAPERGFYASGSSLLNTKVSVGRSQVYDVQEVKAEGVVWGKDIDVLKIDAEGMEWKILNNILEGPGFDRIGRVYVEDHVGRIRDEKWREEREQVKAKLADAGVEVLEWD